MRPRVAPPVGLPLGALLLVTTLGAGLVGCSSTNYSCASGECQVSLKGNGATTEVADNVEVVLVGTDGESADLSVAGRKVSCAEGDTVEVTGIGVTCDAVAGDDVELTLQLAGS